MPAAKHGTRQRYKDGCHCDPCKAAEAAYKREQRKRRNARKLQQPEGAPTVAAEPTSVVPFKPRAARDQVAEVDTPEPDETATPPASVHGTTEAAVLAELSELKTMETRPGLVAVALALARVLDSPSAVAQWPSAAHRLSETLDKLRKGSEGKGGRLASVQRMTGSRKATG